MAHPSEDDEPLWTYLVEGALSGNPAFGGTSPPSALYFTHNKDKRGSFTILDVSAESPSVLFTQRYDPNFDEAVRLSPPANGEFGPVAVATSIGPDGGNYKKGRGNSNDMAFWGNLAQDGITFYNGYTWAYQTPADPSRTNGGDSILALASTKWSTFSAPAFRSDGAAAFFTGNRGWMRGWIDGREFHQGPNIKDDVARDGPNPPSTGPVLSRDGTVLYTATTSDQLSATDVSEVRIDDGTGGAVQNLWTTEVGVLDGRITTGPLLSPNGMIALIFTEKGTAYALDTDTGSVTWSVLPTSESVEVSADFSVYGDRLYYVTEGGALAAWTVGGMDETPSPTPLPTTLSPVTPTTESPTFSGETDSPTSSPVTPTDDPTPGPTTASPTSGPTSGPTGAPVKEEIPVNVVTREEPKPEVEAAANSTPSSANASVFAAATVAPLIVGLMIALLL